MAGGTPDHSAIAVNIAALLSAQLRGRPCRVLNSDLRIRVVGGRQSRRVLRPKVAPGVEHGRGFRCLVCFGWVMTSVIGSSSRSRPARRGRAERDARAGDVCKGLTRVRWAR